MTERGVFVGGAVLALALAIGIAVDVANIERLRTQSGWVSHTHEVRSSLEKILSDLKDAESGQRGYVITGDERYLRPYDEAAVAFATDTARLEALTADNPAQAPSIAELRAHAHAKLAELAESIRARREQGFDSARAIVATDRGRVEMEALRGIVSRMAAREDDLLRERERSADKAYRVSLAAAAGGGVIACLLVVACLVLLRRHLTERDRSTRAITEQRELLQTTLASIGDGVITTDDKGHVTFMNPVAEELTGWKSAEARDLALTRVFRIVNEDTRQETPNPALRALAEGVIVGLANHTILIARDGSERPIDDSAAPIRVNDVVIGCVLVFRDFTERARIEAELEEADRRKDEFLATLAHELRNPLAPISNALHLLERADPSHPAHQRARETMRRQTAQLVRLVDDLLDAGRIRNGKLVLAKQRLQLRDALEQGLETVMPAIEAARHHLSVGIPDKPIELEADPARLAQVFSNLVGNAAKFTPSGGHIDVTASREDGMAVVRIKDDGMGIDPRNLDHIFGLFSQVERTVERGGLGIGLSLVRQLVTLHGGTVEAHSAGAGRGSEFVVRLPAIAG